MQSSDSYSSSLLDGWAAPASHAMLPRLVDAAELTKANSFVAIVDQLIQLGGWAVGDCWSQPWAEAT